MGKKYLFSPIGNTDPIKYLYDGSMLHICRYYEPDVVYLYLSKEMAENHKKDNRYVETLNLLGDFLNHKFEVHIIENPDMVEVQQYDVFYDEFRKIISEIEEQKEKEAEKPQEEKTARVRLNDKRKMSFKEKREFEQLEKEIAELEAEKTQIEELLCSGTLSVDELTEKSKRLPEVNDMIDEKTMRWLELSEIEG